MPLPCEFNSFGSSNKKKWHHEGLWFNVNRGWQNSKHMHKPLGGKKFYRFVKKWLPYLNRWKSCWILFGDSFAVHILFIQMKNHSYFRKFDQELRFLMLPQWNRWFLRLTMAAEFEWKTLIIFIKCRFYWIYSRK